MRDPSVSDILSVMQEMIEYLHSWACTRSGRYAMIPINSVKNALISIYMKGGDSDVIEGFKQGVMSGAITLPENLIAIADIVKKRLYNKHIEKIRNFETKYHIKHEENNK